MLEDSKLRDLVGLSKDDLLQIEYLREKTVKEILDGLSQYHQLDQIGLRNGKRQACSFGGN